ncbi:MAG: PIG-L family deacetylase [Paracoccaceae bacterium]
MPIVDAARIAAQRAAPLHLMLWRALQPLRSPLRFMNTGAHPDDEHSGMLAALTYRDGLAIAYACSTRGEGGQNDIGREASCDLGTLRTAEMERAADVLGLSIYWLSESPDDPITDFGFSKSGVETLAKWGHARTLRRMVEIIRADRPDILCPTFLDIPGQHGHHRAMTQVATEAMDAAADRDFDATGRPWHVAKLYLPAWSGAGDAYDDDLPPPPETTRVPGTGREPVSGWTWNEIGQHSRVFHATQGMGQWVGAAEGDGWPLHLAISKVGPDVNRVTDNLPASFADIAPDCPEFAALDAALRSTVIAFPDVAAIIDAAAIAIAKLRAASAACPPNRADAAQHRLRLKERQLARVLMLASGAQPEGHLDETLLKPGQTVAARLALTIPTGAVSAKLNWQVPAGWTMNETSITAGADARPTDPYPTVHHAQAPRGPVALTLEMAVGDISTVLPIPLDQQILVLPTTRANITPDAALINCLKPEPATLHLTEGAVLKLPDGWTEQRAGTVVTLLPPRIPPPGLHILPITMNGQLAQRVTTISHPHVGTLIRPAPATLRLRVTDIALPDARIGYVGGGNDRVDHWLRAMGCDVEALDDAALEAGMLDGIETMVIGLFAIRTRPVLRAALPRIHRWVKAGGTLLTLYHRPWDAWDPETTPPKRLEIGKPSLRFRVTHETAKVRHLSPDHPILTGPNAIGPEDWAGWVKERGLYFAKSWDRAYTALLEMADPGEAPHQGALLSAEIGKGRHTHCALILHHQMEHLVPGAFRLMANLVAPR